MPKEPVRLSFIISRLLSFDLPEKSPSDASISPSVSVPPEIKISPITRRNPVNMGVSKGFVI